MHTPRLCIDARAAAEYPFAGIITQEVIDQLVSATGEPGASIEWIEKARTVLITHPGQAFSGQLRRFDTRRRIGRSPIYFAWEKHFVKSAAISAFHRFRPIDRLSPAHKCQIVTTVLPPTRGLPFYVSRRSAERFVVPSQKDALLLEKQYGIPEDRVAVVKPGVRRFIHYNDGPRQGAEGTIVFLTPQGRDAGAERTVEILSARFPTLARKVVSIKKGTDLSPMSWISMLQNARLLVYLPRAPFDWPMLAIEALFWGIPTVFSDDHNALSELLPGSHLKMSRFLVDTPDAGALRQLAEAARFSLFKQSIFDSLGLAKQYRAIYSDIAPTTSYDAPVNG